MSTYGFYAISTHFKRGRKGCDYGAWRHFRSGKMYQNDHIFIAREDLKRVRSCRNQSVLADSDHMCVKLSLRLNMRLARKATTQQDELRRLGHDALRPFHPKHGPVVEGKFVEAALWRGRGTGTPVSG